MSLRLYSHTLTLNFSLCFNEWAYEGEEYLDPKRFQTNNMYSNVWLCQQFVGKMIIGQIKCHQHMCFFCIRAEQSSLAQIQDNIVISIKPVSVGCQGCKWRAFYYNFFLVSTESLSSGLPLPAPTPVRYTFCKQKPKSTMVTISELQFLMWRRWIMYSIKRNSYLSPN